MQAASPTRNHRKTVAIASSPIGSSQKIKGNTTSFTRVMKRCQPKQNQKRQNSTSSQRVRPNSNVRSTNFISLQDQQKEQGEDKNEQECKPFLHQTQSMSTLQVNLNNSGDKLKKSRNAQKAHMKKESIKKDSTASLRNSISNRDIPLWAVSSTSQTSKSKMKKANLSSMSFGQSMHSLSLRMAGMLEQSNLDSQEESRKKFNPSLKSKQLPAKANSSQVKTVTRPQIRQKSPTTMLQKQVCHSSMEFSALKYFSMENTSSRPKQVSKVSNFPRWHSPGSTTSDYRSPLRPQTNIQLPLSTRNKTKHKSNAQLSARDANQASRISRKRGNNSTISETGMSVNSQTRKGTSMSKTGSNLFRSQSKAKVILAASRNFTGSVAPTNSQQKQTQKPKRVVDEDTLIDKSMNLHKRAAHNMAACVPFSKAVKPFPVQTDVVYSNYYEPTIPEQNHSLASMMSLRGSQTQKDMKSLNQ